jgi:Raf kinase inhibitor-like YbhB/YbcL family protein
VKCKRVLVLFFLSTFLFVHGVLGEDLAGEDTLTVSSPVFKDNGTIPSKYTCDGADINPPLVIEHVPDGVKSLALIVDDPDAPAGTWVHWVLWNVHPGTREIKENSVPKGALQGLNDFRKQQYGGPCPPSGTHRYFFKLYALDTILTLSPRTTKTELEESMKGYVIEKAHITGLYKRK